MKMKFVTIIIHLQGDDYYSHKQVNSVTSFLMEKIVFNKYYHIANILILVFIIQWLCNMLTVEYAVGSINRSFTGAPQKIGYSTFYEIAEVVLCYDFLKL